MNRGSAVPEFLSFGDLGVDAVAMVEHLPQPDEKVWVEEFRDFSGGMMGNAAAFAAMLGASAGVVALLGHDARGDLVLEDLTSKGVDTRFVRRIDAPTFWALSLTAPSGERALLQFPTPAFSADWVGFDRSLLSSVRWIHTSADQGEEVGPLLADGRRAGATTSLDIEHPYVLREDLADLLNETDVAFVNRRAAEALGGIEEGARIIGAQGCSTVLVTLGEEGCLLVTGTSDPVRVPAHPADPVDTNGAGDAFAGAFAVARLRGLGMIHAAEFANMIAAMSTTAMGGHGLDIDRASLAEAARSAGYGWWERTP
ncbi:MAG: carbohydrate kinase family protein [Sciscionella sp.]